MKVVAPADLADHENENRAMVAAASADPADRENRNRAMDAAANGLNDLAFW